MIKTFKQRARYPARVILLPLAVSLLCMLCFVCKDAEQVVFPRCFRTEVEKYAAEFGLDESLVYAVIKTESKFDPEAVSCAGAAGLMQLMPDTFRWLQSLSGELYEAEMIFTPDVNIRCGCMLLRLLLDEYGSLTVALSAYNAGMGNVTSWLSDAAYSDDGKTLKGIPFTETRRYVRKVLWYKEFYEKIYGGMENV